MDKHTLLGWEAAIKARGISNPDASRVVGREPGYFSQIFSRARSGEGKVQEPGASVALELSRALGISVEELMGESPRVEVLASPVYRQELHKQSERIMSDLFEMVSLKMAARGARPVLEDVLSWWRQSNGQLQGHGQIEESFDLINVPDPNDRTVVPHRVGAVSLASQALGEASKEGLKAVVDIMSETQRRGLVKSYHHASLSSQPIFSEPLRATIRPTRLDLSYEVDYIRMQLPVQSPNGTPFIVSYCFPI